MQQYHCNDISCLPCNFLNLTYCWNFIPFLYPYIVNYSGIHILLIFFFLCIHGYFLKIFLGIEFQFKLCEIFKTFVTLSHCTPKYYQSMWHPQWKYLFPHKFYRILIKKISGYLENEKIVLLLFNIHYFGLVKLNVFHIF